jgi:hypothetical protein
VNGIQQVLLFPDIAVCDHNRVDNFALPEMNQSGNIIQPQIELSNSALLAANLVTRVLRASSEDDVQPQAALAMEALGQRL